MPITVEDSEAARQTLERSTRPSFVMPRKKTRTSLRQKKIGNTSTTARATNPAKRWDGGQAENFDDSGSSGEDGQRRSSNLLCFYDVTRVGRTKWPAKAADIRRGRSLKTDMYGARRSLRRCIGPQRHLRGIGLPMVNEREAMGY